VLHRPARRAELEYTETEDPAIYVAMATEDRGNSIGVRSRGGRRCAAPGVPGDLDHDAWTILPTSRSPSTDEEYVLAASGGRLYVVADKMSAAVAEAAGWTDWKAVGRAKDPPSPGCATAIRWLPRCAAS
jgi:isoleucyl-tRNA synthetase